ncbi:putative F420-dependent oxidoreductase [Haloactinopolyspora alba]|uniref:Putative F420-dependent oxidoreductase n=1 Tax=Haloactinopolyspora alba TaxID=648780 RepID=A0A2P8DFX9_9ACTN|nr:TIGR03620 family F420-dependent LLM class oxidoreductase [Haloactinopolyspora alba]PSK96113.1 putative F420-dependent oxidoreductase [Haloactinopolyspora alba]
MTNLDLGRLGLGVGFEEGTDFLYAIAEAEQIGYSTVWLSGGQLPDLDAIGTVLRATGSVNVGSGILAVDRFPADHTAAFFSETESETPGRLVLGLGGAYGPSPLTTINEYLDALEETVPLDRTMLAALGPKMLDLARERTAGALPALVTPEFTRQARQALGQDSQLAVQQIAIIENDIDTARELARPTVEFLMSNSSYAANARRMGFNDADISGVSDDLVDALVPSGDIEAVAAAVNRQYEAGADHVAVSLMNPGNPVELWRALAAEL